MTAPYGILGSAIKWHLALTAAASAALPFTGRPDLLPGLWTAWGWISLNGFLIGRLLRWSVSADPANRKMVMPVLMIKFPVLYVAGFFAVLTRPVTLEGVFAGFTLYLAAIGAAWAVCMFVKRKEA